MIASLGDPRWHHLPRCGSTSDEAARLGRAGAPDGTVVLADEQERGRGRLGRTWHSPPEENLYLSLLLRPAIAPHRAPLLTLCAGVALADALAEEAAGRALVELKWPNDVLLRPGDGGAPPRKAGGILTEMVTTGARLDFVVIGIGVNLGGTRFPPELAGRATSLSLCLGAGQAAPAPAIFAARLIEQLSRWYAAYLEDGPAEVLARFVHHAAFLRRGEPLQVRSGAALLTGWPAGLAEDGSLQLRDEAGALHRIVSGELEAAPEQAAPPRR